MTIEEYMAKLKGLLSFPLDDTTKDNRLLFTLETVIQVVLTYCNITVIPAALNNVILQITEDYYRSKYTDEFPQTAQSIQSVKRGDVQTNFGSAKPTVKAGPGVSFVQAYENQLRAFRRLRW